ncbi:MAG: TonB-dependent receptor [Bacteroidota bacterium]
MKFFLTVIASWSIYAIYAQDSLQTIRLEEVAVTAVRAQENAPIPQTNISKKQIDERYVGQHPIFLMEQLTPGVFSFSESGTSLANYGQIRLRGINQERINFTLNGVPLNDMIDQGVFFSNFTDIANNFESIQIQRGVGTSSNGVSSYAGSVNFESLNLRNKEAYSQLQLGAGSFDTYRANFQNFTGLNDQGWGFLTSFSKLTSTGFRDNTGSDATSFFMTGGKYGEKDVLKLTFFTSRSENGLGYLPEAESVIRSDNTFNTLDGNNVDDFSQFLLQLQYNRILSSRWTGGITGYYGGAGGDFTTFGTNSPLENDHFGTIVNADFSENRFTFNTGVHLSLFLRENRENMPGTPADPDYLETSDKKGISWFGKATYELGDLTAFADLQMRATELSISPDYDVVGINSEGDIEFDWLFVNPKIGFTYDITDALSAYSSFGRSGREPTRIDLFGGAFRLDARNYDLVRTGNSFSEEFVNDFELGARYVIDKLSLDANFYYMRFENEIAPIGRNIDFGVQARGNIPKSTRTGFEVQWTYVPNDLISFSGTAAYLETEIEEQTRINDLILISGFDQILSPDWIWNAQVKVNPTESISASLFGRYIGEQFLTLINDDAITIPSSFVANFQLEAQITPEIQVSGMVNNLFDNLYFTNGIPPGGDFRALPESAFFAQPTRNYFLSLNFTF